jgi:hypothetical protein
MYGWKADIYYEGGELGPPGERAKGRWIICGYSMTEYKDYDKTASPSADMVVWRVFLSLSVQIRFEERVDAVFDVTTAYLWALKDRKYKTFMKQAAGFEEPNSEGMCWELGTHLYGEPDAGLGWYKELSGMFQGLGYVCNPACPSQYSKLTRKDERHVSKVDLAWYDDESNAHRRVTVLLPDGSSGVLGRDVWATYVLMQVDDGKVVGNCSADLVELRKALDQYESKWHFPCVSFLGAEEEWTGHDTKQVTAKAQIDKFQERYDEHLSGRPMKVPVNPAEKYKANPGMDAAPGLEREEMDEVPYREVIGSLNYITRLCHPSIAFGVGDLSQYVSNPGRAQWKILQMLGDFVVTQRDVALTFRSPPSGTRQLVMVYDANWAGDKETRRSVDNSLIFLWGNLVDFGPKKQKFVACSSFESELGGCARGGGRIKNVGSILLGMGIMIELPVPCYGDNESVLHSLTNVTHGSSAKHIDIRKFWMKDEIDWGTFEMMHVLSGDNLADVMTKALAERQFWPLMNDLMGKELTVGGRLMRQGKYAYRQAALKHRLLERPLVGLHKEFPGPAMDEYHGKAREALTGEEECG